jgi:hypothetical protein
MARCQGADTIFSFDQEKFDFEPNDPVEVVRRSEKLREIGRDAYGENMLRGAWHGS